MEVLYETLMKIQLTFVQKKKGGAETQPELGSLPPSWPHGQGEPSTQTKSNTLQSD